MTPACAIRPTGSASPPRRDRVATLFFGHMRLPCLGGGMPMRCLQTALIMIAAMVLPMAAFSQGKPAPDDAYLYFVWPQDGTIIRGGFWCRFGLRNMGVTHAGHDVPNSGHHHLLIDVNEPLDPNEAIAQDKNHLHFGAGQNEARIEPPPGKHTLAPGLGDAKHFPFKPPVVSKKITVMVK